MFSQAAGCPIYIVIVIADEGLVDGVVHVAVEETAPDLFDVCTPDRRNQHRASSCAG